MSASRSGEKRVANTLTNLVLITGMLLSVPVPKMPIFFCSLFPQDVSDAILQLADNKACGLDKIQAEHLKYASSKLFALLSICFTGFLVHGILPDSILAVLLVPVIKNKAGKINSSDNYRPIALASILSKVLERAILDRLEQFIQTSDNQFGFKPKHGTDMCIFALNEILDHYNSQNSTIFMCFIDASKAFDRICHSKLFEKLVQRGVPMYLVRILAFWYANQQMQVKWGNSLSATFNVSNGVRQGSILSPSLFNVYMDDLSVRLNGCGTGCWVGNSVVNHLMYADDLVVFSPYSAGLQQLLRICSQYGTEFDIKYNASKSNIMIARSRDDKNAPFPDFNLSGSVLEVCDEIKYLGHFISSDLSDDKDINRQCRMLYAQANTLLRKFSMCSEDVKIALFRTYCTPMYTAQLWRRYRKSSMQRLTVAYNDCMRLLLKVPRCSSASQLFVSVNVPNCSAVLRNLMFRCMCRVHNSGNSIIVAISNPGLSAVRFSSRLWNHWRFSLYVLDN